MPYNVHHHSLDMLVEPAKPEDIDEIAALENRAYPSPWRRNVLLSEINGEAFSYFFVARFSNQQDTSRTIIGYHIFWVVAGEAHILNIAVAPEFQGQGLGRALLQFGLDFARDIGAARALLEVRVSNTRAQRLYQRLGFRRIGVRKQYYSDNHEDAYAMKLEFGTRISCPPSLCGQDARTPME